MFVYALTVVSLKALEVAKLNLDGSCELALGCEQLCQALGAIPV